MGEKLACFAASQFGKEIFRSIWAVLERKTASSVNEQAPLIVHGSSVKLLHIYPVVIFPKTRAAVDEVTTSGLPPPRTNEMKIG